ncbi:hypothetical protein AAB239_004867 [Escherichia coli]|nr:hypothetical protein [Escherichia coli]
MGGIKKNPKRYQMILRALVFVEGRWQFDDDKLNTLHHLGAGTFVTSGKRVTAG